MILFQKEIINNIINFFNGKWLIKNNNLLLQ